MFSGICTGISEIENSSEVVIPPMVIVFIIWFPLLIAAVPKPVISAVPDVLAYYGAAVTGKSVLVISKVN